MAESGLRTTGIPPASSLDELLGNKDGNTAPATVDAVAAQMAASGPIAEAIAEKSPATDVDAIDQRLSDAEAATSQQGVSLTQHNARLDAMEGSQTTGLIVAPTWDGLLDYAPSIDGTGGEVPDTDAGTHNQLTATGYDGEQVPNAGQYRYRLDWAGWEWIRETGLTGVIAQLAALLAELERRDSAGAFLATPADDPADDVIFSELDAAGQPVRLVHRDGRQSLDRTNEGSAASPVDQQILIDAAGHPILSVDDEGVRIFGMDGTAEPFADGAIGARTVSIADASGVTELTSVVNDGDCFAPRITADRQAVRFVSDLRGTIQPFVMTPDGRNRMVLGDGVLRAVYAYGQSLSVGVQISPPVANTTDPLFPGANLMSVGADSGETPRIITDPTANPDERKTQVDYANIAHLVDLREGAQTKCGQTFLSRMGAQMQAAGAYGGRHPLLFNTFGVGGSTYDWLGPEDVPWANLCRTAFMHQRIARDLGLRFEISGLVFVHGHSNAGADQATYEGYLTELEGALAALCSDLGQDARPFFAVTGLATSKFGSTNRSEVPLAQLNWATTASALSDRIFAGPDYPIEIGGDGTHPTADGYDEMGDRIGLAVVEHLFEGGWSPLRMVSATGAGTASVTVSFAGAVGSLGLDTAIVSDPGAFGFTVSDDGGDLAISSVTIVGSGTQVQINLSRSLIANPRVEYALTGVPDAPGGPTSGPRGCLRDSRSGVLSNGNPAHQYCAAGSITIS